MKKIFAFILALPILVGCGKNSSDTPVHEATWEEQLASTNGELLASFDKANTEQETFHTLPADIKWNAMTLNAGTYLRLGISFLSRILAQPATWHEEEMDYNDYGPISKQSIEPFPLDAIPFEEMKSIVSAQNGLLEEGGDIDTQFSVSGTDVKLSRQALTAMLCRVLSHYYRNHSFPVAVSTSEGSYIHSTSNCNISAPEVLSARDEAWRKAGVTEASSTRLKAEAIFNYGRDEWDYEGYFNTSKGAVGTIKSKNANCCDMSHAICAMARLSGIPSRYFHGQCKYSSGYIGHVISQLYVDGKWEFADATNNSNTFGKVSFTDAYNVNYYETLPF